MAQDNNNEQTITAPYAQTNTTIEIDKEEAQKKEEAERKDADKIQARYEEVMDAVHNVQQGKPMFNTGNGDFQTGTYSGNNSSDKPDRYIYPEISKTKTKEEAQEWWNSYWAKQLEQKKEQDLKRLERQRLGKSLGDIANVIGDIIQASNGAVVLPRDVQKQYDNLSAQQKQIIDNYWARMDGLRKEQEAKDAEAAKAEREAEKEAARLKQAREIADMQEEGRQSRAADDIEFRRWKTEQDNQAKIEAAQARGMSTVKKGETENEITFSGKPYTIPKNAYKGRLGQLYAYLYQNNLFPDVSGLDKDMKSILFSLINNSNNSNSLESSMGKVEVAVLTSLPFINEDKHVEAIIKILKGTNSNTKQTTMQSTQKQKKVITGFGGN